MAIDLPNGTPCISVVSLALKDNIRKVVEIEGEVMKIRHMTVHNATRIYDMSHNAFNSEFFRNGNLSIRYSE
jgi:hypothetical protein